MPPTIKQIMAEQDTEKFSVMLKEYIENALVKIMKRKLKRIDDKVMYGSSYEPPLDVLGKEL